MNVAERFLNSPDDSVRRDRGLLLVADHAALTVHGVEPGQAWSYGQRPGQTHLRVRDRPDQLRRGIARHILRFNSRTAADVVAASRTEIGHHEVGNTQSVVAQSAVIGAEIDPRLFTLECDSLPAEGIPRRRC